MMLAGLGSRRSRLLLPPTVSPQLHLERQASAAPPQPLFEELLLVYDNAPKPSGSGPIYH